MAKPTLATVALGGCEGCHVSLIDAHEGLLDLLEVVDLVNTPTQVRTNCPTTSMSFSSRSVETEADLAHLRRAREVAGTLVANGSCAVLGGIGGLRNLVHRETCSRPRSAQRARSRSGPTDCRSCSSAADRSRTSSRSTTRFRLRAGDKNLLACAMAAVAGDPYDPPRRNLCDECPRVKDKLLHHTQDFISDNVFALMELDQIDPEACLLEQGVVCMGPMTREGCGAKCTSASVPCRGCMGPSRLEFEQGGKAVDALAAVLPAGALMYMEDLIGTTYRFSLGVSVFPGLVDSDGGDLDA